MPELGTHTNSSCERQMLLNGYRLEDELSRTKAHDIPDRSAGRRVLRVQKNYYRSSD